jgi:hypothetical protein
MKRVILFAVLVTISFISSGQTIEKDNVFTLHVIKVRLKSGVTMEQFTEFMTGEFLPAWEKHYEGVETILLKAIRGAHESEFGWINYYPSEEKMKEFYPEPGKKSEKAKAAALKMKSVEEQLAKFGTMRYSGYTTWEVLSP